MTLIFHDWFANSNEKVDSQRLMLGQNELLRAYALGSFTELFRAITIDPAMLVFLDGVDSQDGSVNENYAREMMELFSLGADRGAYTEQDIRQLGRALTGWTADYAEGQGWINFRYDAARHDKGRKTVFGQGGNYGWEDAVTLCLDNPYHPSFFAEKLWRYFMPMPADAATSKRLADVYRGSGRSIRAVVEAILLDERFYSGPAMVKPPVVYVAGLLRTLGRGIDTEDWVGLATSLGQRMFYPPNVSGWTKDRWLDTSTYKGRWDAVQSALAPTLLTPRKGHSRNPESADEALQRALAALGSPPLTGPTRDYLIGFSARVAGARRPRRGPGPGLRAMRQNALRQLILASPDYQTA
jgi:uncharacterized protein (DUF1800 family)